MGAAASTMAGGAGAGATTTTLPKNGDVSSMSSVEMAEMVCSLGESYASAAKKGQELGLDGQCVISLVHDEAALNNTLDELGVTSQLMRRNLKAKLKGLVDTEKGGERYLAFLSHHKGGAAAIAQHLQDVLPIHVAKAARCEVSGLPPVFLDCDHLKSLTDLIEHVKHSMNLVVLMTSELLSRPWCLIEITTAVMYGVKLIPVRVVGPDVKTMVFPDDKDAYCDNLLNTLPVAVIRELHQHSFLVVEVSAAVRKLFDIIALTYDTASGGNRKEGEIKDIAEMIGYDKNTAAAHLPFPRPRDCDVVPMYSTEERTARMAKEKAMVDLAAVVGAGAAVAQNNNTTTTTTTTTTTNVLEKELQFQMCTCTLAGTDAGSGARQDLAYCRPDCPPQQTDLKWLGHVSSSSSGLMVRQTKAIPGHPEALAKPTTWKRLWSDQGSGKAKDYSVWVPDRTGYKACGLYIQFGVSQGNKKPPSAFPEAADVVVVRQDLVEECPVDVVFWTDAGSGIKDDLALANVEGTSQLFIQFTTAPGVEVPEPCRIKGAPIL